MRYFLKQNLPGIKAGVEMEKKEWMMDLYATINESSWKAKGTKKVAVIPNSELSDWIEERDGTWKPKEGEIYYTPEPCYDDLHDEAMWRDDQIDNFRFSRGLVCPTPELAIELAERQIETAKKFWEEKK